MRKRWQRFSAEELRELWTLWKDGHTYGAIGQALAVPLHSVYTVVSKHGGLPPRERTRAAHTLDAAEREEISRGLASGDSMRCVARRLGRAPSTISREIRRHGGVPRYRATEADKGAWMRARRPKRCRLALNPVLRNTVAAKLRLDWSPQQISKWLLMTYPSDPEMHISHETIYRTLYVQARGALKKELVAHLRRQRGMRHSRKSEIGSKAKIIGAVSIAERPPQAEDRAVPGHWEGDMLAGNKQSNIVTLVERKSRFAMLIRLTARDSESVVNALIRRVRHLPNGLMRSLTWDRGLEMANHRNFTVATDVQVYFCDPRSPWQRGSNENTNGLLRQYFPKGMDLSNVTQRQLDVVANKLNTRPRETLDWKTPAQVFAASVAATD
jgi:IS30 family transposase